MSGHTTTCSNCGQQVVIECDKRNIGTGRQRPLSARNHSHDVVLQAIKERAGWSTIRQLQAHIGNRSESLPLNPEIGSILTKAFGAWWTHEGRRPTWNYVAVQAAASDLVGWKLVEMQKTHTREWAYRAVEGMP